jgi:hypothetical protein
MAGVWHATTFENLNCDKIFVRLGPGMEQFVEIGILKYEIITSMTGS